MGGIYVKTVTLWRTYNPDRLFGGYSWHIEEVRDGWNHVYSDPFEVEIPDDFYVGESVMSKKCFFKQGCNQGYELTIGRSDCENGNPYLIGGIPVESIKLKVIGKWRGRDDPNIS